MSWPEEVLRKLSFVFQKGYIAYRSALELHSGRENCFSSEILIASPLRARSRTVNGVKIEFVTVLERKIFGLETRKRGRISYRTTDLEKTVADCLDNPRLAGGTGRVISFLRALPRKPEIQKIFDYTIRLENQAALKRLGFVLEKTDLLDPDIEKKILERLSGGYVLLDPSSDDGGPCDSKWLLRINIDLNGIGPEISPGRVSDTSDRHISFQPEEISPRERLTRTFRDFTGRKLMLLEAPAGSGKTAFTGNLYRIAGITPLSYVCDVRDRDVSRLVKGISCLIGRFIGNERLCRLSPEKYLEAAEIIASAISDYGKELYLSIDSAHYTGPEGIEFINTLLRCAPPTFHLIYMTRTKSGLSLSQLRMAGELAEIGPADLSFSFEEFRKSLSTLGTLLPLETLNYFYTLTEGHPGLVKIVSRILEERSPRNARETLEKLTGAEPELAEFFRENVIDLLEPEVLEVIQAASIPGDEVTLEMIENLTGKKGAVELLERALKKCLFITRSTRNPGSFRLHPLFARFLDSHLKLCAPRKRKQWHESAMEMARKEPPGVAGERVMRHALCIDEPGPIMEAIRFAFRSTVKGELSRIIEGALNRLLYHYGQRTAEVYYYLGCIAQDRGNYHEAITMAEKGLELAKRKKSQEERALYVRLSILKGEVLQLMGRPGDERAIYNEIENLAASLEDNVIKAHYYGARGTNALQTGELEEAEKLYRKALELFEEENCLLEETTILNNLGVIHRRQGRLREAMEDYQRAVRAKEILGDEWGVCFPLTNLAVIHYFLGEYDRALAAVERAHAIRLRLAEPVSISLSHVMLGNLNLAINRFDDAMNNFCMARQLLGNIDNPSHRIYIMTQMAQAYWFLGRWAEAESERENAAMDLETLEHPPLDLVMGERILAANLLLSSGKYEEAEKIYLQVLDMFPSGGSEPRQPYVMLLLSSLFYLKGDTGKAEEMFMRAFRECRRCSYMYGNSPGLIPACLYMFSKGTDDVKFFARRHLRENLPQRLKFWIESFNSPELEKLYRFYLEETEKIVRERMPFRIKSNLKDIAATRQDVDAHLLARSEYEVFFYEPAGELEVAGLGRLSLKPGSRLSKLLSFLMLNAGKYYTPREIFEAVWEDRYIGEEDRNRVLVAIFRLRKMIEKSQDFKLIISGQKENDVGYTFNPVSHFCLVLKS